MFFNNIILMFFFFFSSRRRHTRSKRDWSSDVCSSDLRSVTYFVWQSDPDGLVATVFKVSDRANAGSPQTFLSDALGGAAGERIGPGTYTITRTNTTNNCTHNATADVQQNTIPDEVISATGLPLTNCGPADGS